MGTWGLRSQWSPQSAHPSPQLWEPQTPNQTSTSAGPSLRDPPTVPPLEPLGSGASAAGGSGGPASWVPTHSALARPTPSGPLVENVWWRGLWGKPGTVYLRLMWFKPTWTLWAFVGPEVWEGLVPATWRREAQHQAVPPRPGSSGLRRGSRSPWGLPHWFCVFSPGFARGC